MPTKKPGRLAEGMELAVLETYLPKQMTRDEVIAIAQELITNIGASSKSDMGKVMGQLMPKLKDDSRERREANR